MGFDNNLQRPHLLGIPRSVPVADSKSTPPKAEGTGFARPYPPLVRRMGYLDEFEQAFADRQEFLPFGL